MVESTKTKKTKTKKTKSSPDLAELAELSGETTIRQKKYIVPIMKFHGGKGEFVLMTPDSEGNWVKDSPLKEFSGVILKVRRAVGAFEKAGEDLISYYSNEHNSFKDRITLFQKRNKGKAKVVGEGTIKELREGVPEVKLKLRQILYMMLPDERIVKFSVKGKSLAALFEYYSEFDSKDEHIFQYVSKMECHHEENEGISFYVIDFIKGKKSDISLIAEKIKEVASNLKLSDKSYEESASTAKQEREEISSGGEKVEESEQSAGALDEDEQEVKVEDIPF